MKWTLLDSTLADYAYPLHSGHGDPLLDELQAETARFGDDAVMQIAANQGTFLTILAGLQNTRSALEIGTFTGHSSLCIARGLAPEGRLLCLDLDPDWTEVAKQYWQRAGLSDKIELKVGDAIVSLASLEPEQTFDFAHIDAEKTLYDDFYEAVLKRLRPGGLIVFDNMLMGGRVTQPESPAVEAIAALNQKLNVDPRIEQVLIPLGDGIQLCRKRPG